MGAPSYQELASSIDVYYTAGGLTRYRLEISHSGLKQHREIKGEDNAVVIRKAIVQVQKWDETWSKRQAAEAKRQAIADKKTQAAERSTEAATRLEELEHILEHTLSIDDTVAWDSLKNLNEYPEPKPLKVVPPTAPPRPSIPVEPSLSDPDYRKSLTFLEKIFSSKAEDRLKRDWAAWSRAREEAEAEYAHKQKEHRQLVAQGEAAFASKTKLWEDARQAYLAERDEANAAVDRFAERYRAGETEAVTEYCDIVLSRSMYPEGFPQEYELQYHAESGILLVDYDLPDVKGLPTLKEVKYVQSRDELTEKHIAASALNRLYDSVLYQVAIRTIHEIFEADQIDRITAVVFNGIVDSVDPATGKETRACVLSLQAMRDEFEELNLAAIDLKACFKKLKGVAASKLHSLTPVAPIMQLERDDSRFVEGYAVGEDLGEEDNLAAMDWEDFEHLVRELFEKEFAQAGGEVRVTRASRDAGVDAVVFDPDPLKGGKIVIQAKRYTNTVDVSAVRDLFGTLMNEGATKGILVTTSDYGPDAYEFARGKPLTLLNGANLLHLLQRHGHKAKIDLKEAKRILAENQ